MSGADRTIPVWPGIFIRHDASPGAVVQFKAWILPAAPMLLWECRRCFLFILAWESKLAMKKLCKERFAEWYLLSKLLFGSTCVLPSFTAWRYQVAHEEDFWPYSDYMQSEFSFTTEAMLLWFLFSAVRRHAGEQAGKGLAAIAAFIRHFELIDASKEIARQAISVVAAAQCRSGHRDGLCCHCRDIHARRQQLLEDEEHLFGAFAVLLFESHIFCPSAQAWMKDVLFAASNLVVQALQAAECSEDILKSIVHVTGKRGFKRRIDGDFKTACFKAVADHRSSNVDMLEKALHLDCPGAMDWNNDFLRETVAAQQLTWSSSVDSIDFVVPDASRFGNPAEEVMFTLFYHMGTNTASYLIPKAIRDSKFLKTKPGAIEDPEKKRQFLEELASFVAFGDTDLAPPGPTDDDCRATCVLTLKALDGALRLANVPLSSYQDITGVRALKENEQRYYLGPGELLESCFRHGQKVRSCIEDGTTGKRRLEYPRPPQDQRRRLHARSDRGTVGWTQWFPLFAVAKVCGSFSPDPCHWEWDTCRLAVAAAGLSDLMACFLMAVNFPSAPFQGSAFGQSFFDVAKTYFANADHSEACFLYWYPRMALWGGNSLTHFGTTYHLNLVFDRFKGCPFFKKKGQRIKWSRWFSLTDRLAEILPWYWEICCMLCIMAMKKGVFKHMKDVIDLSAANLIAIKKRLDAMKSSSPVDKDADVSKKSLREDQGPSFEKKKRGIAILYCTVATFANDTNFLIVKAITNITEVVKVQHREDITKNKTTRGGQGVLVAYAAGEYDTHLNNIVDTLVAPEKQQQLGFIQPGEDDYAVDFGLDLENILVKNSTNFTLALLGHRLSQFLSFSHSLPGRFFALLHQDVEQTNSTLATLRKWWDTWVDAEKLAIHNRLMASYLKDVVWTAHSWPRLVMLELSEQCWECVPPNLHLELDTTSRGPQTTKTTEDAIGDVRKKGKHSQSGAMGPDNRWMSMLQTPRLKEADRFQVPITTAAKIHAAGITITNESYEAEFEEDHFSLGDAFLREVQAKKTEWRSPSAVNYALVPFVWTMLVELGLNTDALGKVWRGLLAMRGFLLQNRVDSSQSGLVIRTSGVGTILWKMRKAAVVGGQATWTFARLVGRCWKIVFITDLADWRVQEVDPIGPRQAHALGFVPTEAQPSPSGIFFRKVGDVKTLDYFSCLRGFLGVTVPNLQRLWTVLDVPGKKPTAEGPLVFGLAKKILGSDERANEIVQLRKKPFVWDMPTILTETVLADVEDVFDPSDVPDIKEMFGKRDKKAGTTGGTHDPPPPASAAPAASASSSSGSGGGGPLERRPAPGGSNPGGAWTANELKSIAPPGAVFRLETKWHTRWRCHLPAMDPPNSSSAVFGTESRTEREAQVLILTFLWSVWTRSGVHHCPFIEFVPS